MSERPTDTPGTSRPDLLTTSVSERGNAVIVHLVGEIDMTTVDMASAALSGALSRETTTLVVDLTRIRFFASAGLNLLLKLHQEVKPGGVTVRLAGDHRTALRTLELMGLTDLFPIYPTVRDALASARPDTETAG